MKYYVTRSISLNPVKGRPIQAQVGSKISEATYNRLRKTLQSFCIPARTAPRNGDFVLLETDFLVRNWVDGKSTDMIISEFYDTFPGHKVNGGVECQLRIIAGQDNTTDDSGLDHPGQTFSKSMMMIALHRVV